MNRFKTFTGGALETNCFYFTAAEGAILFDAPEGADAAFADQPVDLLILTHGHFDHVADAAAIMRRHGCRVAFHADTASMVATRDFFRTWGLSFEIEPVQADFFLKEGGPAPLLGTPFEILHVPGHCPGSLCFYQPEEGVLVGGDVLFCGGVGRWDLPGGDAKLLFAGIEKKLLTLPDAVTVLPGHGPSTTIGRERRENPYLVN